MMMLGFVYSHTVTLTTRRVSLLYADLDFIEILIGTQAYNLDSEILMICCGHMKLVALLN